MRKIGVIGHFGHGLDLLNGQTIKTKIVYEELISQYGGNEVLTVDTHGGIKTLVKLPVLLMILMFRCRNVTMMPAQNGLRIVAPLLMLLNLIFRRNLLYIVVGGWLPAFLNNKPILTKILKKNFCLFVETQGMAFSLKSKGFKSVFVMPNFKKLQSVKTLCETTFPPYRFCTFSRVMKQKGIEDAVNAIRLINLDCGKDICSLDIYGQIEKGQEKWFMELEKLFTKNIRYCGCVPFDKSVDVLKNYYALLFPTNYEGEGFAGTILDAFSAGIPVIASDWRYNGELILDGENGLLVKSCDLGDLVDKMKLSISNNKEFMRMRSNCLLVADKYMPHNVMPVFFNCVR